MRLTIHFDPQLEIEIEGDSEAQVEMIQRRLQQGAEQFEAAAIEAVNREIMKVLPEMRVNDSSIVTDNEE